MNKRTIEALAMLLYRLQPTGPPTITMTARLGLWLAIREHIGRIGVKETPKFNPALWGFMTEHGRRPSDLELAREGTV